jgi:hypothetical protein
VWTLSESMENVRGCSRVPSHGESATGCVTGCLRRLPMFSVLPLHMPPTHAPPQLGCRSRVTLGLSARLLPTSDIRFGQGLETSLSNFYWHKRRSLFWPVYVLLALLLAFRILSSASLIVTV